MKFLISEKDLGLILSDHPVVVANHWAEHHKQFKHFSGTHGIALRGLQWFLPLSPKVCLAVYDPGTYCYGSEQKRTTTIGMHDLRLLNTMQALNAHECIYFDPRCTPAEELERVQRDRLKFGTKTYEFTEGLLRNSDGTSGDLIRFTGAHPKLGKQISCVRITDRSEYPDYDRIVLPVRSETLIKWMEKWTAELDQRIEESRQRAASEGSSVSGQDESSRDEG